MATQKKEYKRAKYKPIECNIIVKKGSRRVEVTDLIYPINNIGGSYYFQYNNIYYVVENCGPKLCINLDSPFNTLKDLKQAVNTKIKYRGHLAVVPAKRFRI